MVPTIQKRLYAGLVTAAVVTTCTVLAGPLAPAASALPANEVFTRYYSNASKTKIVGTSHLFCSGRLIKKGRTTAHLDFVETPCK